jgi:hypothetical protein
MKLLIITAITEFENDIKLMLNKANVKTFTYKKVTGFMEISEKSIQSNWFASDMNETDSILFYAFVKNVNGDLFFDQVSIFNSRLKTQSRIHVAILNIEKSN